MTRTEIISTLSEFAQHFSFKSEAYRQIRNLAEQKNSWFDSDHVDLAVQHILSGFLDRQKLEEFVSNYPEPQISKSVGLVLSGNLPLVGFADVLHVILSGHKAVIKPSSKDDLLLRFVLEELNAINLDFDGHWQFADRLNGLDVYIATGSDNTARYFKAYFSAYPHIIKQNRNSVAILNGNESEQELIDLGKDVFTYFGLGCRNVSKLMVPQGYDFQRLLDIWQGPYARYVLHPSYKNNYDYNYTLYLMNKTPFLMGGSILMIEDQGYASRIACLHYEYFESSADIIAILHRDREKIQCVVAGPELDWLEKVRFGETQRPALDQFADDVDTMKFLSQWSK